MPGLVKILNWNTEIALPQVRGSRFATIKTMIKGFDADIICLTEAHLATFPADGDTIASALSGWGKPEEQGARKVLLWSRYGWDEVDTLGSDRLPEGRFVSAVTTIQEQQFRFVGMCIPYRDYRSRVSWGEKRRHRWQGAEEYLDALQEDILPRYQERTILLGDFNLQMPPKNYPFPSESINQQREAVFAGWHIPTASEVDDL